ncbi:MAG TPA: methyltransferase [Anaerolineae bacterium]|nr:methyltransferase [Anaerolineae bacterium]
MFWLTLYKVVQWLIFSVFIVFISDHRKKNPATPLIDKRLLLVMKLCYPITCVIHGYVITTIPQVRWIDLVALGCAALGTLLIVKSKHDLGRYHAWTGYFADVPEFVTQGIYAYMRHPLYAGINLFIAGDLLIMSGHAPWQLTLVMAAILSYIMAFTTLSAVRETRQLAAKFGARFVAYQQQVHPFLPLGRFRS